MYKLFEIDGQKNLKAYHFLEILWIAQGNTCYFILPYFQSGILYYLITWCYNENN